MVYISTTELQGRALRVTKNVEEIKQTHSVHMKGLGALEIIKKGVCNLK